MKRNLLLSTLLVIIIMSCQTYEVMHYDVLRPASYSVPPEIKSLVIVDNAYPYNADNAHKAIVVGDEVRLDTVRVDSFSTIVIDQLKEEMLIRNFFDTVYVDSTKYNTIESGKQYQALQQSQIINICNRYNADAVLSLAGIAYATDIEVHNMGYEYYSTMDLRGLTFWRMFDGYSTEALYSNIHRDTLYWDGVGDEVNASVSTFPAIKEAVVELGHYLGYTFANELVPYWEPVKRRIYIAGNQHFVNAAEWLNKGDRYEAEKIWGFIYEHGTIKEKGRAASNIALSMEARGELKLAMEWAYKSYDAFSAQGFLGNGDATKVAGQLYTDLARRYRENNLLDEQLGGSE